VLAEPRELFAHVRTTGAMGDKIIEQSLILDTPQGLVLITGCAHPGIVSILQRTQALMNKEIYLVLGGFHLLQHTDEQVKSIIDAFKSMGVRYCGATHCTGDKAIAAFREAYGDHFVELGAGRTIRLSKAGLEN
jgi:7,8-dihydropterin-6-yl-methyl-4-(beta-D-ribofuranosyl)aminobenzene 5'-phosphate synthase